ncbi:MAG: phosphorylase [Candidatus Accumulibacter phosphatis]|nr:phosphorylase [Candidatus Accumulibacter phosphatis]
MPPSASPSASPNGRSPLPPAELWPTVVRRTKSALDAGALQSIETDLETLEDGGIRFVVRVAANLGHKDRARAHQAAESAAKGIRVNPFQPYEEALFVGDITPTHFCLLNKFNVLEHHLLIITREFMEQESLLNHNDWEALGLCLAEIDGLGLYNAGSAAGASQPHKHLQVIPLPLAPGGMAVPIESAFNGLPMAGDDLQTSPRLPFRHAFARLDPRLFDRPAAAAERLHAIYRHLLSFAGIGESADGRGWQTQAYNLLVTRRWMLLIPRSTECFLGISLSALNFAGSLFVRSTEQLRLIAEHGPLSVLAAVGAPADSVS